MGVFTKTFASCIRLRDILIGKKKTTTLAHTDKNREKIMRKRQKMSPNFLKMRIFLSKLANNSHFEKIGDFLLSFSSNFPMIFVSAGNPAKYHKNTDASILAENASIGRIFG